MKDILLLAEEIAREAHSGQFRKDGSPYIQHIELVVQQLRADEKAQVVAWLHDVIEDTDVSEGSLIDKGIPKHLVAEVVLLTKRREQSYKEYIAQVKGSALATKVKKADLVANLFDQPGNKQFLKFSKALVMLSEG